MPEDHHAAAWQHISAVGEAAGITVVGACQACADDVEADFAGVTLISAGKLRLLAAATDERARAVEDAQLVAGEGPCTEALTRRGPVEVPDLHDEAARWPAFASIAAEQGVRSILALPLMIGTLRLGAMDLNRCAPGRFTPAQRDRAGAYARILALLALDEHPRLLTTRLQPTERGPQGYPPSVYQAAGVLAARWGLAPDDALARIRAHSFRHNQPLLRTAEHVLDHQRLD
ncbi:GAF and ANTAR domain-containing protein [Streptomyces sp. NPDC006733]|uniref:GAF and ANTAR domain-containing protein n=1 Tax=Streptomyces sp. NPDC006733 TaxID=3155460 RepID=UPI0033D73DA6